MGESAPFWRFSAASYPDLEEAMSVDALSGVSRQAPDDGSPNLSVEVCFLAVHRCHLSYQTTDCNSFVCSFSFIEITNVILARTMCLKSYNELLPACYLENRPPYGRFHLEQIIQIEEWNSKRKQECFQFGVLVDYLTFIHIEGSKIITLKWRE